jgi:hypothetical protein
MIPFNTIAIIIGLLSTLLMGMSLISNIFKNVIFIIIIEGICFMSMIFLELPNILCFIPFCIKIQNKTSSKKIVLVKSIMYILFGSVMIPLACYYSIFGGLLSYLFVILTGVMYMFSYRKSTSSIISLPDLTSKNMILSML